MSATKILWGQVTAVFAIVLITVWVATQWMAWRLGYQPQLGQPWFELWRGVPVYLPPAFFWWWYAYYDTIYLLHSSLLAVLSHPQSETASDGCDRWGQW